MPYLDERLLDSTSTPSLGHLDASGINNADNAGTADTVVIELGDTVIRADQFQESISSLQAYVIKCAESSANFTKAFNQVSADTDSISARLRDYFKNDRTASALPVVNNLDGSNVTQGVAAVISNTVDIPIVQMSQTRMNKAWADWIIPTLFEGKLYGVVRGDNMQSGTSVSDDTSGTGNIGTTTGDSFEDKDLYIKRMFKQMGIYTGNADNKATIVSGVTGKRVIFLATLVSGPSSGQGGGPDTTPGATLGRSDQYNSSNQNQQSTTSGLGTSTRIALEFKN